MKVSVEHIKKLRDELGVSISDIRYALEESDGNEDKARELLKKKGLERAEKKSERQIKAGRVFSYIHHTGAVGAMVVLGCETDFVARTDEFQKLGAELVTIKNGGHLNILNGYFKLPIALNKLNEMMPKRRFKYWDLKQRVKRLLKKV